MPTLRMHGIAGEPSRDGLTGAMASDRDVERAVRRSRNAGSSAATREIVLTDLPVRVTGTGAQELRLARDIGMFDELDLELRVLTVEGASPSCTVEIQTGMQFESTTGWVTLASFTAVTSNNQAQKRNFTQPLRWVRWNVAAFSGTACTFCISGIGRSWT